MWQHLKSLRTEGMLNCAEQPSVDEGLLVTPA